MKKALVCGAGFVFTGENDADIMHNSALINLNMVEACHKRNIKRVFYSSSECIYPEYNQMDPDNPNCAEDRLMRSDFTGPVNIGSEERVTINQLAEMVMKIARKKLAINHIPGPQGVRGRNSDNKLIYEKLGWKPTQPLYAGLEKTYAWIEKQVKVQKKTKRLLLRSQVEL